MEVLFMLCKGDSDSFSRIQPILFIAVSLSIFADGVTLSFHVCKCVIIRPTSRLYQNNFLLYNKMVVVKFRK